MLLLPAFSMFSQAPTTITENYLITGPLVDLPGTYKYSYIVSDDGERIKNGPISITGKDTFSYNNFTVTGNYNLSGSIKKGDMNGPINVKANYHYVERKYGRQEVADYAYSLTGSFINGVPNGTFNVKATNFGTSTATYKNGVLVGAYNVDEAIDDRYITIKGAFDANGRMIGTWRIENLGDVTVWEFINGIRTRISTKNEESTPKQIEMAKKFATKSIKEEDLEKQGYTVVQDSIQLGDYASDLYFLKNIIDWEQMGGGYDFSRSYWVKYTYLYNVLPLSDKAFSELFEYYKRYGEDHRIRYDEKAKAYAIEYLDRDRDQILYRRYTDEQLATLKDFIETRNRKYAYETLSDFIRGECNDSRLGDRVMNMPSVFQQVKNTENIKEATHLYSTLWDTVKRVDEIKNLNGELQMTKDSLYYVIISNEEQKELSPSTYLLAEDLIRYRTLAKEIRAYFQVLDKKVEENKLAKEKQAEEARSAKEEAKEARKSDISQVFISGLSGIEKQSVNKTSELLNSLTVKMGYRYYELVPKNSLNITPAELAEAIAPVIEYSVIDIKEEASGRFDTYRVTMEFTKKKGSVPVSMSITNSGNIIDGSISIPEDILNVARKNAKNKQAISDFLKF